MGFKETSWMLFSHSFFKFLDFRMLGFFCLLVYFAYDPTVLVSLRSTPWVILWQSGTRLEMKSLGRGFLDQCNLALSSEPRDGMRKRLLSPWLHCFINELSHLPILAGLQIHSPLHLTRILLAASGWCLSPGLMARLLETCFSPTTSSCSLGFLPSVGQPPPY